MLNPSFVTGIPNWIDLGTPDVDRATAFYRGLFGWELVPGAPDTGGYGMYMLNGNAAAGVMTVPEDEAKPSWSVYFQTPDAEATATSVAQAGGTVLFAPMDVREFGRMAGFTDNQGAYFGVWQPGTNRGLGVIQEPGSLLWSELHTPDVSTAAAFFQTLFGWEADEMTFPGGAYTTVGPAGAGPESSFGGIAHLGDIPADAGKEPHWLPYFAVEDCDAASAQAERLGGSVTVAPQDVEGVGRIAHVADPFGAAFALIKPAPMPQD
ncbi:VOC family protein [Streptomyces sp. NPDC055749]